MSTCSVCGERAWARPDGTAYCRSCGPIPQSQLDSRWDRIGRFLALGFRRFAAYYLSGLVAAGAVALLATVLRFAFLDMWAVLLFLLSMVFLALAGATDVPREGGGVVYLNDEARRRFISGESSDRGLLMALLSVAWLATSGALYLLALAT